MTNAQNKAIETLKSSFFKAFSYKANEYEFKEVFVEEWNDTGIVYVRLEMGLIGDEGTMAEIFARNSTAVCIGKRGGYFSYRDSGKHSYVSLSLTEACYWGFNQERIRKKRMNKEEA